MDDGDLLILLGLALLGIFLFSRGPSVSLEKKGLEVQAANEERWEIVRNDKGFMSNIIVHREVKG
jgi:hypothetical protein